MAARKRNCGDSLQSPENFNNVSSITFEKIGRYNENCVINNFHSSDDNVCLSDSNGCEERCLCDCDEFLLDICAAKNPFSRGSKMGRKSISKRLGEKQPSDFNTGRQYHKNIEVNGVDGVGKQYQQPKGLELWRTFRELVERYSSPNTPHEVKLQHTAYLTFLGITIIIAMGYAGIYIIIFQEPIASTLAIFYCIVGFASIKITVKCDFFYPLSSTVLLHVVVVNPFLVQFALMGVVRSGCVMLWSLLSPVMAALVKGPHLAWPYFYAYIFNVLMACIFEWCGHIPEPYQLMPEDIILFGLNHIAFGTAVFLIASTFASHFRSERSISEHMLLSLFPASITERLKKGENPIIDDVECVTVLFANVVDFMHASSSIHPTFLVGEVLRDLFLAFDHLVDRRGLEKIKTNGDEYLVAGGLGSDEDGNRGESSRDINHTYEVILLAFDFQEAQQKVYERHGISIPIRIGVHTGPVVAGVLGVKRFAYDIWGDTVNTASRMESHGIAGSVHVSSDTYDRIRGFPNLECIPRGATDIKGKGIMQTYLVKKRRHSIIGMYLPDKIKAIIDDEEQSENDTSVVGGTTMMENEHSSVNCPPTTEPFGIEAILGSQVPFLRPMGMSILQKIAGEMSPPDTPPSIIIKRATFLVFWVISLIFCLFSTPFLLQINQQGFFLFSSWAYVLSSAVAVFFSLRNKIHYSVFETFHMVATFLIIILTQFLSPSGIINESIILWIFLLPLGSALVHPPLKAQRWFFVYIVSTITFHVVDYFCRQGKFVSTTEVVQFAMNNIGALSIIFTVIHIYAAEITKENSSNESLLLNALPLSVARRLRLGERPFVDTFQSTTILIADLVGFTRASAISDPHFLIGKFLRDIFFEFDKLVEQRQVEKIKTIGDAIVVVGGLSDDNMGESSSSHHATQLVLLATEFHRKVADVNRHYNTDFEMRIGVHTGSIIAGVLGTKRNRYDVWGDSVQVASVLEKKCLPGSTLISASTYNSVKKDIHQLFDIKPGAELAVQKESSIKMKTYLVTENLRREN